MRILGLALGGIVWATLYAACTFLPLVLTVYVVVTVLRWMGVLQ